MKEDFQLWKGIIRVSQKFRTMDSSVLFLSRSIFVHKANLTVLLIINNLHIVAILIRNSSSLARCLKLFRLLLVFWRTGYFLRFLVHSKFTRKSSVRSVKEFTHYRFVVNRKWHKHDWRLFLEIEQPNLNVWRVSAL